MTPKTPKAPGTRRTREVEKIVEEFTSDYSIRLTNNLHYAVELRRRGKKVTVYHSSTPSDRRALLNFRAQVRRCWASIGGTV